MTGGRSENPHRKIPLSPFAKGGNLKPGFPIKPFGNDGSKEKNFFLGRRGFSGASSG
jgi:hypothetical protein